MNIHDSLFRRRLLDLVDAKDEVIEEENAVSDIHIYFHELSLKWLNLTNMLLLL